MKKIIVILLYIFIFMLSFFVDIKTDTYAITGNTNKKKIVDSNVITKENKSTEKDIKEEQETKEDEKEEIETGSSDEIQTTEAENYSPVIETNSETFGTYGRLYVSGFSVALYDYNVNTNSGTPLQTIVDNYDSAAFYYNRGRLVIADHDYQGFSILTYLTEGTTSYIKFEDGSTIQYRLIKKAKGYNTGPDLVDTEGNSFFDMDSDIIMYTCYDGGVMVTLWSY